MHVHAEAAPGAQLCSGLPWNGPDPPTKAATQQETFLVLWVQLQFWEAFSADKAGWKHCSKRIPKVLNYLSTKAFTMEELVFFLQ